MLEVFWYLAPHLKGWWHNFFTFKPSIWLVIGIISDTRETNCGGQTNGCKFGCYEIQMKENLVVLISKMSAIRLVGEDWGLLDTVGITKEMSSLNTKKKQDI